MPCDAMELVRRVAHYVGSTHPAMACLGGVAWRGIVTYARSVAAEDSADYWLLRAAEESDYDLVWHGDNQWFRAALHHAILLYHAPMVTGLQLDAITAAENTLAELEQEDRP